MKAPLLLIPMVMVCQGRWWVRLKKAKSSLEGLSSIISTAPTSVLFQVIDVKLSEILFLTASLLGSQSDVGYSSMKEDGQTNQKPQVRKICQ